ncbi:hypothetical protein ACFL01_01045 [Planctomycetota bacterium]
MRRNALICIAAIAVAASALAADFPKPYDRQCTERENVFAFTKKPAVRLVSKDRYEIAFAVKGYCDVTVGVVDKDGTVIRHVASGVLGKNAPAPFQKDSLEQKIHWNGKDDLGFYHKKPNELAVRVMLGLKPVFDKRIGGTSPKNFPGYVGGIAIGPDGGYVFIKGPGAKGHTKIRHFDHDGNYVKCVAPPPANMPHKKLAGLGYVEYEPGKRSIHGPVAYQTTADRGGFLPGLTGGAMGDIQIGLADNRLYWCDFDPRVGRDGWSLLYHTYTDGSTDIEGMKGRNLSRDMHRFPRLLASLDGKWLYMCGVGTGTPTGGQPVIMRRSVTGEDPAVPFIGKWTEKKKGQYVFHPGSDNDTLNGPSSMDIDARGRIYVTDHNNGRIQIFSPDGKYLKTIKSDRPRTVRVHKKTGGIYVANSGRVQGKSVDRITKYTSFDDPKEEYHVDNVGAAVMAMDSWSDKPRLWAAGSRIWVNTAGAFSEGPGLRIYEEQGKTLKKISDFEQDAEKEAGKGWFGPWPGTLVVTGNLVCDPIRETVVYGKKHIFDIKTGEYKGVFRVKGFNYDDIAFDRRGYMHIHWNPTFEFQGVSRVDPGQAKRMDNGDAKSPPVWFYPEVPYDYGIEETAKRGWLGILPVKDQGGAKGFQDGLAVNMRGDVAVESNIYYVPKMEDSVMGMMNAGSMARKSSMGFTCTGGISYQEFMKGIQDKQKKGEDVYSIRRRPGISLAGGTIWTFDSSGELRKDCAVTMGKLVTGPQMDEDGAMYFVNSRPRMLGNEHFLRGKGGIIGAPEDKRNRNPFTGTLIRTIPGKECSALLARSQVALDPLPPRPPDMIDISFADVFSKGLYCWVDGAAWLYAGASPNVSTGCSCPTQRMHLDWYKRSFVPEAYRHSFGVLDTNGNLIMHLGKYGNWDSAMGSKSKIRVGGDDIAVFVPRYISGTDNYLVYESWSERLTVLKIDYHAEETVAIASN